MRAIVLSGGGGKGAYQTGVWKALRQLQIDYDIVTGTSIGSINAVFMTYGDYNTNFKIWNSLNYNQVFEIDEKPSIYDKYGKRKVALNYAKGVVTGGLNTEELRNTLINSINIEKFYKSKVNYGLITVKFPSLKPVCLTKNEINKDELIDYLLASASAFPALKMTNINDSKYIDGGYFDNLPINLAIKMGADEIIAIDLRAIGRRKKIIDKNIKVTTISPSKDIGNFLVMEKKNAKKAFRYGYFDAMKVFSELEGDRYTFKLGSLSRNYKRIGDRFINICLKYIDKNNKLYVSLIKNKEKMFNKILEDTCYAFEIDDTILYRTSYINEKIKRQYKKFINEDNDEINFIDKLSKENIKKEIIVYIYKELNGENKKKIKYLSSLFPNNFLCAIYLKTIYE